MLTPSQILTTRFVLRPLNGGDVGDRYLERLKDQTTRQYIVSVAQMSPPFEPMKESALSGQKNTPPACLPEYMAMVWNMTL